MFRSGSDFARSLSMAVLYALVAGSLLYAPAVWGQTAKDLKCNGCVDAKDIKKNAVNGSRIKNGSVGLDDLAKKARGHGAGGVLVIGAAQFNDRFGDDDCFTSRGFRFACNLDSGVCLGAPALLPPGAKVTKFEMMVQDNSASQDIDDFDLSRLQVLTGVQQEMASVESSGASGGVRVFADNTIRFSKVDTTKFAYYVETCWTSDPAIDEEPRLYGARISYK